MKTLIIIAALLMGPPIQRPTQVARAYQPAEEPNLDEAEALYAEGKAEFEAANYPAAIEAFTGSLKLSNSDEIRGRLMLNIALSHMRQFDIDRDEQHLRQAKAVYKRYVGLSEKGAQFEESDVAEAKEAIDLIDRKLGHLRQIEANKANAAAGPRKVPPPPPPSEDKSKKQKALGIGLLSGGSVVVVTGVSLLAYGSTYKRRATDQVTSQTGEVTPEGQAYIDTMSRRGATQMGIGGALMAVGVSGVVVGALQLRKAKQGKVSWGPSAGPGYTGVVFRGRF